MLTFALLAALLLLSGIAVAFKCGNWLPVALAATGAILVGIELKPWSIVTLGVVAAFSIAAYLLEADSPRRQTGSDILIIIATVITLLYHSLRFVSTFNPSPLAVLVVVLTILLAAVALAAGIIAQRLRGLSAATSPVTVPQQAPPTDHRTAAPPPPSRVEEGTVVDGFPRVRH